MATNFRKIPNLVKKPVEEKIEKKDKKVKKRRR